MGIFELIVLLFTLSIFVFLIASEWIVYTKANQPGWACIIPIYDVIVFLRIVGKPWWWIFLLCIPIVNIVIAIMVTHLLAKSFGKDVGYTLGLLFLPIIFYPILAFGDAEYEGPAGA